MSSDSFDAKISNATSSAEIAEICKQAFETAGVIVRERDGSINIHENFTVPAPAPQSPAQSDDLMRRAVTLKNGTIRVIEGYSTTGLDILERHLRQNDV